MNKKIVNLVLMYAVTLLTFIGTKQVASGRTHLAMLQERNPIVESPRGIEPTCFPDLPCVVVPNAGPGPVCWPGTCVISAAKEGPGPVCFPGVGCVNSAAKAGPGPVCFPGVGCVV